ncbi:hypothetical protein [Pelagicoccus sp. SDUM812002]|uniref:hypothetical protein n=1 Tax=Pelagicoccus sp. SDUM812002 TaxID=3041266 RepID=UPI00280C4ABD|nr:hypothetical protein [Pelagicoccus sp. SDUM812002]MDQ8187371.1 hypothetical protein [Pelagicoccus sp. SDUM812002]
MRHFIAAFTLLALAASARAELTIISTEHRDAASFKRVSEYLTGKHSDGRYAVYRSDTSRRDGFYISLLASEKPTLAQIKKVRVQFVRKGTQEIESFESPVESLEKKRILVGFTGEEWNASSSHPVAWKIDLLNASGTSLESAQSFLWTETPRSAEL